MAVNKKISELDVATTPLAGTEQLAGTQAGATKRIATADVALLAKDKTAVNGILKGNGTGISAAVAGTDYSAPSHRHFEETITPDVVEFQSTPVVPTNVGSTYWDAASRCLATVTGTNTTIQHGQELPILCNNDDGAIVNGQPVRVVAGTGNIPRVVLASGALEGTSYLIGMATEDILASPAGQGMVTVFGLVNDISIPLVCKTGETGANWVEGLPIFLSTETGKLTVSRPPAPAHGNFVGSIMNRTGGDGAGAKCSVFCHPTLGFELHELHDVLINTPTAGQVLTYNDVTSLWENKDAPVFEVTYSVAGTVAVKTGALRRYLQKAGTIIGIYASVGTAPVGSALSFDIRKNGVTHAIMNADMAIADGANAASTTSIDSPTVSIGDYLTVDITGVGSGTAGSDLTITIRIR